MISIEVSPDIEKQFAEVIRKNYDGNSQAAIVTLLELHRKYGWKEQLRQDVDSIRAEVRQSGGIRPQDIDAAIRKYRKTAEFSDA